MRNAAGDGDIVRQHSGWLIPLVLMVVIVLLCAAFLGFYLRPSAYGSGQISPTMATAPVSVHIHGRNFIIPSNYIAYEADRAGGARSQISLVAVLPGLEGYTRQDAALFAGDAPNSPLLYLLIREEPNTLSQADRLARIYRPYFIDPAGVAGPFDLTQYSFRSDSGYRNDDLFVGQTVAGMVFFLCVRPTPEVPSPNCLAIDRPETPGIALSYRFKRTYLSQWHAIGEGVARLMAKFEGNS